MLTLNDIKAEKLNPHFLKSQTFRVLIPILTYIPEFDLFQCFFVQKLHS